MGTEFLRVIWFCFKRPRFQLSVKGNYLTIRLFTNRAHGFVKQALPFSGKFKQNLEDHLSKMLKERLIPTLGQSQI